MKQKIILITGASSGMGKVTAKDLIKQGHIVYCASRNTKNMDELKTLGGKIIELDMSKNLTIEQAVKKILKEQKKIDILWNNAGYGLYGPVEEININDAKYQFEVNLFGLAKLTQLILPIMRKQNSGLIINTSSIGGKIFTPLGAWYHATKHALEGWSDCLRLELKDFNIDVVILEPGLINTKFYEILKNNLPERSRTGPYKKIVNAMLKASNNTSKGSSPKLISKTIQKIIRSKRPKTRYAVGRFSTLLLIIRKYFSDRFFEKVVMSQLRSMEGK